MSCLLTRPVSSSVITAPHTATMTVLEYLDDDTGKEKTSHDMIETVYRVFESHARALPPPASSNPVSAHLDTKSHLSILGFLSDQDRSNYEKTGCAGYRAGKLSGLVELDENLRLCSGTLAHVKSLEILSSNFCNRDGLMSELSEGAYSAKIQEIEGAIDEMRRDVRRVYLYPHSAFIRKKMAAFGRSLFETARTQREYIRIIAVIADKRGLGNCGELTSIGYEHLEPKMKSRPLFIGKIKERPGHPVKGDHAIVLLGNPNNPYSVILDPWRCTRYLSSKRDLHLENYTGHDRGNPLTTPYCRDTHFLRLQTFTRKGARRLTTLD